MGLQKQVVQVPLLGLDTHSDPKNAPPGSYELSENEFGRRIAGGGIEWRKRFGTTSMPKNILGGGTISNARKMAKYGSELLVVTDTKLYAWSPIAGAWVDKGNLTPAALSTKFVASSINGTVRVLSDAAIGGGLYCGLSNSGGTVLVTVIDLSSGTTILSDAQPAVGSASNGAHVIALSDRFMIITMTSAGTLKAVSITYAAPSTFSAVTVIATNGSAATARWAVARNGTTDQVLIAYNGDAANRLRAVLWNSNMTSAGSFLFAEQPDGAICWLHHDYSDGKGYIAYVDSTRGAKLLDVTIAGFAAGAAALLDGALLVARNITGYHQQGPTNTIFVEVAGTQTFYNKVMRSTGGAFANWQLGAGLRSSIFKVSSAYYVGVAYEDGLQDKYFVLNAGDTASPPQVIATALDGNGSGLSALDSWLSSVPAISSTVVAWPVEKFEAQIGPTINGRAVYGAVYLRADFAPTGLSSPKQIGASLVLPGAVVRMYDGALTTEAGFLVAPIVRNGSSFAGAGNVPAGTYQVTAVYVYEDGQGQEHFSAPSDPYTLVVAVTAVLVQVDVTNCRIGDKSNRAWIDLFYTAANGTTYYSRTAGGTSTASDFVTIPVADLTSANQGEELYTTGRALPHNALPPASLIEVWGDRAFLAHTDAPNELWVSDEIESGTGLSFSQANVLTLPSEDGEVSTINEFDDRLVIGKLNGALYPLSGSGPAANGDGQYQTPSRINSVVGPIGPNGVIKTSAGLIFTSLHGRYLLPRGGADPVRLAKIEGYDSLTVTGASNVDGYEQTRLVTSEGRTLVYHYGLPDETGLGHWSTFTGQSAVDCANFGGSWCYLSSDGTVHVEVAGQYADDGVAISRTSRFNWLAGGGTFGNIRLYAAELLGEVLASCTLTATVAYDFDATIIDTRTEAVTVGTKGALELRPSRGRSTAVQFAISEVSSGEGYRLTALAVEIGAKPGFAKQAASAFLT